MNFREKIGLRQAADDYFKGINNTIDNLYRQGLEEYAQENINQMKAYGFKTYTDSNGREKLSRGAENKELYKSMTEQTTEEIKKHDLYNVKTAKAEEARREQIREEYDESGDDYDDSNYNTYDRYNEINDDFSVLDTFYDIAKALMELYNEIARAATPISIQDAMAMIYTGDRMATDVQIEKARTVIQNLVDYEKSVEWDV